MVMVVDAKLMDREPLLLAGCVDEWHAAGRHACSELCLQCLLAKQNTLVSRAGGTEAVVLCVAAL